MEKFWEDYHRMNTPSEDERAQEFWDDVDREIFGPDYKMIGGRLDIRGQNTESAASLATKQRRQPSPPESCSAQTGAIRRSALAAATLDRELHNPVATLPCRSKQR
jgi:hypothetical protein